MFVEVECVSLCMQSLVFVVAALVMFCASKFRILLSNSVFLSNGFSLLSFCQVSSVYFSYWNSEFYVLAFTI